MKIVIGIEYCGNSFSGWQRQAHARGVQAVVESALAGIANCPIKLVCAGRTDSGVHATKQVAHFETDALRPDHAWVLGANSRLPVSVRVLWAREVDSAFHARFSALTRTYRYYILNRPIRSAVHVGRVAWERRALDLRCMRAGASHWLGRHDFSSFRAAGCQSKHPMRTVHALQIDRRGELVRLAVTANAFLYRMVRNMVGVLVRIGVGDRPPEWAGEVLRARDRAVGGVTATPDGLYLHDINYPEQYAFPASGEPFVLF